MHRSRGIRRLPDLLPIIAIILVLLPILACAVRHAREASEQQICTDNLKRMGVAAEMYQADWDDVLVPVSMSTGGFWPVLLDRYIKKIPAANMSGQNLPPEYQCPSRPDQVGWAYERTYGMNGRCGSGTSAPVPVRNVRYPHATIRIAESAWDPQGGSFYAPDPSTGDGRYFPTRHADKGNALWMDGHVSAMTTAQYTMTDTQPDRSIWLRLKGPKPAVP